VTDTKRELNKALGWFGSATLVMQVLDVVSTIAVLRFLTREELGVASLSLGVTIVAEALSGLGVAGAIVQAPTLDRDEQDSSRGDSPGRSVPTGLHSLAVIGGRSTAYSS
jgi:O-antigen/teichoic acid export membrane protein